MKKIMEDYKEKYEHLLKFINDLYPRMTTYCKEKIDGYLSELKESKEEKIRKELWGYFNNLQFTNDRDFSPSLTIDDILAWLEKQDPKKREEELENAYRCVDEVQYKRGYEDAKREFKKQGKQRTICK